MWDQSYERVAASRSYRYRGLDQDSWRIPEDQSVQREKAEEPEDTYFAGNAASKTFYPRNKQSLIRRGPEEMFTTEMSKFNNRNFAGNGLPHNPHTAMRNPPNYILDPLLARSHSQFVSDQLSIEDRYGKMARINPDDGDEGYYAFPDEPYMTNLRRSAVSMNPSGSGRVPMNVRGLGASNVNMIPRDGGGNMRMGNGRNNVVMDSVRNLQLKNQIKTTVVGTGPLALWHAKYEDNFEVNSSPGNFFNDRVGQGSVFGLNNDKGANKPQDIPSLMGGQQNPSGLNDSAIHLNAANFNQWCFLRKGFKRRDNDFAEHIFEVHEKFCLSCKDRIEAKKLGIKRKHSDAIKEVVKAPEQEVPVEEVDEEELEMKKLMGFEGFQSTKGAVVKDNLYSAVIAASAAGSSEETEEAKTLTEEEKRIISLRGGFSVFKQ